MYPLNMHNAKAGGYAVANDEAEHKQLSEQGYEPKLEKAAEEAPRARKAKAAPQE